MAQTTAISMFLGHHLVILLGKTGYKKSGKWKNYLYGERVYIVLSLVAKTILAWLVLFGAMQP